jgi:hypothetical protein
MRGNVAKRLTAPTRAVGNEYLCSYETPKFLNLQQLSALLEQNPCWVLSSVQIL